METKRINFICMDLGINGGTKSILSIADALTNQGHQVNVIYPKYVFPNILNKKTLFEGIGMPIMRLKRELTNNSVSKDTITLFTPICNVIQVPRLTNEHIPDADFTFATWWETVEYVKQLSSAKGKKCYLIQHYEVWGGNPEKVKQTYREGFVNIVHSNWLKNIIELETGAKIAANISHCPEHKDFYDTGIKNTDKELKVMMIYRNIDWKGMADGIEAFETCRKYLSIPAKLVLVGEKPNFELNEYMEFHEHPDTESLRTIYNKSDIFLFPSWNEGFGLPPMEAMCCGTAVVTTDVGAIPDYAQDRETALLSPPKNSSRLAINLNRVMSDAVLRKQLANNAKHFMEYYTWDKYAIKLMEALNNAR